MSLCLYCIGSRAPGASPSELLALGGVHTGQGANPLRSRSTCVHTHLHTMGNLVHRPEAGIDATLLPHSLLTS